jgi:hypothetical protein
MLKLRNPFARVTEPAESERPPQPEPRTEHRGLELDRASRQIECCRYIDQAMAREPRRARFATTEYSIFGD